MRAKRLVKLSAVAVAGCSALFGLLYATIERPTPVNPMKILVSRVPLASTADNADALMGMSPVSVEEDVKGYLMSPVTMLAAENERAPKDQIETYTLRKYRNNGDFAVVAIDSDGLVAGKWAGSVN